MSEIEETLRVMRITVQSAERMRAVAKMLGLAHEFALLSAFSDHDAGPELTTLASKIEEAIQECDNVLVFVQSRAEAHNDRIGGESL